MKDTNIGDALKTSLDDLLEANWLPLNPFPDLVTSLRRIEIEKVVQRAPGKKCEDSLNSVTHGAFTYVKKVKFSSNIHRM